MHSYPEALLQLQTCRLHNIWCYVAPHLQSSYKISRVPTLKSHSNFFIFSVCVFYDVFRVCPSRWFLSFPVLPQEAFQIIPAAGGPGQVTGIPALHPLPGHDVGAASTGWVVIVMVDPHAVQTREYRHITDFPKPHDTMHK